MGQETSKPEELVGQFEIFRPKTPSSGFYMRQVPDVSIAVVGPTGCGKTALVASLAKLELQTQEYGYIRFSNYQIRIYGTPRNINIMDIKGNFTDYSFKTYPYFYRGIPSVVIVYSVTDRKSFEDLDNWTNKWTPTDFSAYRLVLLGNKSDLKDARQVSTNEGEEYAKKIGAKFYETSVQTGSNVFESFYFLSKNCLVNRYIWPKISKEIHSFLFPSLPIQGLIQTVMDYVDGDIYGIQRAPQFEELEAVSCLIL